jgi:hypothetical protein
MRLIPGIIILLAALTLLPHGIGAQSMDMKDHEKMMKTQGMLGSGANECFKNSMEQAIKMHEMHIRDKATDTKKSNQDMMDEMKHAEMCLTNMGIPGGNETSQNKQMQCADDWMKKAIALHQKHMDDPSAKTDASQKELLRQMRAAYNCTGPARNVSGGDKK